MLKTGIQNFSKGTTLSLLWILKNNYIPIFDKLIGVDLDFWVESNISMRGVRKYEVQMPSEGLFFCFLN